MKTPPTRKSNKRDSAPATPRRRVVDTYHGIEVAEEYRWLEDPDDPKVKRWTLAQNRRTRSVLDGVPTRKVILARVRQLMTSASADYTSLIVRAGLLFAIKRDRIKQQPVLVRLSSVDPRAERAVVDPNRLDAKALTAIDFYVPSLSGRLVAVSLSRQGSEDGTLHLFEVATGKELPDRIPRVNYPTGGGSVAWTAEDAGFFYTRYPHEGERPPDDLNFYQQVYYHQVGHPPEDDTYVIGKEFPRIAETTLVSSEDGRWVLADVKNGDGGEHAHYLHGPEGAWAQVTRFQDECKEGAFGPDGCVYLLSREGAPRGRIIRMPLERPELSAAETVVPEGAGSIERFEVTAKGLYVVRIDGGLSEIRVFDGEGHDLGSLPIEPVSSVEAILRLGGDEVLFRSQSFITPPAWYRIAGPRGPVRRTRLAMESPAGFSHFQVEREFATSRDGTRVPLNIVHRKGIRLNGRNPLLLTGYGGYGMSLTPYFLVQRRVWLEQGGVFAAANLRGGGEYGEEWHRAGNLTFKQNVFDDFLACAQHLVSRGYTSPERLAIQGASNGGLLMGAVLAQKPELFRAVVAMVGIYDMLRVELDPNGSFNVTEFGTVKDLEQFKALFRYSPYHHVIDGARYPAVLLIAGENDGRVNPAHSRKMTARLQAATGSPRPVLLRSSATSGHGIGTALNDQIAEIADMYTFLFDQVGVHYRPVAP